MSAKINKNEEMGKEVESRAVNEVRVAVQPVKPDYKYLIPALLVAVMLSIFLLTNWMFIACPNESCGKIDGKLLYVNDQELMLDAANANKSIASLRVANTTALAAPTIETESNANTATNSNRTAPKTPAVDKFRQSLSIRYRSRITWILQTTVFYLLMLGIIWFAGHVIIQALKPEETTATNRQKAEFIVRQPLFYIPLGFGFMPLIVTVLSSLDVKFYSPITNPIFEETIYALEGIKSYWFGLTNTIVFIAMGGLVTASCAIFYKIRNLNESNYTKKKTIKRLSKELADLAAKANALTTAGQPPEPELMAQRIAKDAELEALENGIDEDYKDWRVYTKILLYLGGAILTFGLLRMTTLSEWHLAFVMSPYQQLLREFFSNSLFNQAIFYTILLMSIYLPVAYNLPETSDDPTLENSLSRKGFFATITKFAPQLLVLLSPLLTKSVSDFISKVIYSLE